MEATKKSNVNIKNICIAITVVIVIALAVCFGPQMYEGLMNWWGNVVWEATSKIPTSGYRWP